MAFKDDTFSVVEIFKSLEGEGIRTGLPAVFVRFAGCNLNCSWCDTKYAQDYRETTFMTREKIATKILSHHCNRVTFTGGEPLQSGANFISWFCSKNPEFEVNIETNGSISLDVIKRSDNMIVTMDYKCPSSGMTSKMRKDNFSKLRGRDVLKFVVSDYEDLNEVVKILMEYHPDCRIYVSPVFGKMDLQKLAQFVLEHDFLNVRMGLQIHKIIWAPETRGV